VNSPLRRAEGPISVSLCKLAIEQLPPILREHVKVTASGCWVWTGALFTTGYGLLTIDRKLWRVHRLSWTLMRGPIPPRFQVCHHCDNPPCINPNDDHLFLGTNRDNQRDKAAKGRHWQQKKTVCPQGHAYTPENTYISKTGHRRCLICLNASRKAVARG
jgi:hypothetical protein